MRDLQEDAEDSFLPALNRASDENIEQFVNDTINRGEAHNANGDHTVNINRIKQGLANWRTGTAKVNTGDRQVATSNVLTTIGLIKQTSRDLFVSVQQKFGLVSNQVPEFFPGGLTAINTADRGEFKGIITRLKGKTTKYVATLTQDWVDRITALEVAWDGVQTIQSDEKSDVEEGKATQDANLPVLAKALTAHYLTVRLKNEADPSAAVAIYFDETPLKRNTNPDNDSKGRFLLQGNEADGSPVINGKVFYTFLLTGKTYTGKTNSQGKFRSPSQPTGMIEGYLMTSDGLRKVTFTLEIKDDSDPENLLVMGE